jgi:hypothetical protein
MLKVAAIDRIKMSDPSAPAPNVGALSEKLEKLNTSAVTESPPGSAPGTPGGHGHAVVDNGTNLGSLHGRKASVGAKAEPFAMERRVSGSAQGSRRPSRRGSGVFMTPSGTQAVYHTRTHVRGDGTVRPCS